MGEKVAKTGIQRDNALMYYVSDGHVWAKPRGAVERGADDRCFEMDNDVYIYYVDIDGDVTRNARPRKRSSSDDGEKVAKLGLTREPDRMYYIKAGDVWAVPQKLPARHGARRRRSPRSASRWTTPTTCTISTATATSRTRSDSSVGSRRFRTGRVRAGCTTSAGISYDGWRDDRLILAERVSVAEQRDMALAATGSAVGRGAPHCNAREQQSTLAARRPRANLAAPRRCWWCAVRPRVSLRQGCVRFRPAPKSLRGEAAHARTSSIGPDP